MALNRTIAAANDQGVEEVRKYSVVGMTVRTWLSDRPVVIKVDHGS